MPSIQTSCFKNIKLYWPKLLLVSIVLFTSPRALSQEISEEYKKKAITLITEAPKTYQEIDAILKKTNKDSLNLLFFIEKAKEANYLEGQSYAINQLGIGYRHALNLDKSIEAHLRALSISDKAKNDEFRILSLNMLGVSYTRKGAIKTAIDYHQKAIDVAEKTESKTLFIKRKLNVSVTSIGNLYQTLSQYDLAISQYTRALALERAINNIRGLAINNENIGDCLEKKGQLENALKYYQKSLAYHEKINNVYGQVSCKNSIARIYTKQGMHNAALEIFEPLKNQAFKIGDSYITSSFYINIGNTQTQVGDYKKAKANILKGLGMAEQSKIPALIVTAKRFLANLAETTGDYKEALKLQKEAEDYQNKLVNQQNLSYINEMIVQYDSEKKNNKIELLAQDAELSKIKLRKNQTTILVVLLTLGLIGTMLFIMYRKYHSDNEKKVLSLEQNMLRSQMNPHFLFNSLNSIKLYIINNDKKNAVHYLNKFSKLVRKILEGSSLKEISLSEELETAGLYLNIENIRFSDEISFAIYIAKEINPEQVKIPSLILQPFLENAIWHGLSPKKGQKKIWLNVYNFDNYHIGIDIIDNGVGRNAAEKIKKNRVLKRKSVGIDITTERLANFSKDYQNDFEVTIEDLTNEKGAAQGTKIILKIPTI